MARQRAAERKGRRAAGWTAAVVLVALAALPVVALPDEDAGFSDMGGNYTIPAGKTHHGNLRLFKATVTIAGKQEGDLWVFGGTLDIPGEVTGKVGFIGNNFNVTGKIGGNVDAKGASCVIAGDVGKDLDAKCGTVEVKAGSHVAGDALIYAGQIGVAGAIDGDLTAEGGQIDLSGAVGKNASLRADVVKIDDKAKVAGDLSHESRVPVPDAVERIVGGKIGRVHTPHVRIAHGRSFLGRFAWWFSKLALGMMAGLGALALSRKPGEAVLAAMRGDVLRNLGVGFLTFIVVPVAAVVSCVLILTIPLAVAVLLLYALAVYLAKVPVAVSLGRYLLLKLGRPEPSPYGAFAAGVVVLYVLFAIPVLGWILWFACAFLGLGAMVLGLREWRQARRQPAAAATPSSPAPSPGAGAFSIEPANPPPEPPPVS